MKADVHHGKDLRVSLADTDTVGMITGIALQSDTANNTGNNKNNEISVHCCC